MKTQNELIDHYTSQLEKVISSHGLGSDYFYMSVFNLKGIQAGMTVPDMIKWSKQKMDEIHEETLSYDLLDFEGIK
jgi:hypothetical protein